MRRTSPIKQLQGFALPTVLIASVVLLMVLAVSVTSASTARNGLKDQYYTQLARNASEAGAAYARACLEANGNVVTWSNASPLRPETNCSGTGAVSNCSVATCFVVMSGNVRSRFSVGQPLVDSSGDITSIPTTGYAEIIRTSDSSVWRTYTQPTFEPLSS